MHGKVTGVLIVLNILAFLVCLIVATALGAGFFRNIVEINPHANIPLSTLWTGVPKSPVTPKTVIASKITKMIGVKNFPMMSVIFDSRPQDMYSLE